MFSLFFFVYKSAEDVGYMCVYSNIIQVTIDIACGTYASSAGPLSFFLLLYLGTGGTGFDQIDRVGSH